MMRSRRVWGALAAMTAVGAGIGALAPSVATAQTPAVTANPATDLVDGTSVTVTISGLGADDDVTIQQCRAHANPAVIDSCDDDYAFGTADESGQASVTLRVDTVIDVYDYETDESVSVDCRTAEACVVGWYASDDAGTIPLHFTPGGALAPPPTATVTPDDGLTDHEAVTVDAAGLVWSARVRFLQCAADPADSGDCSWDTLGQASLAAGATTYTGSHTVDAVIDTGRGETVDCREAGACVLAVTQDNLRGDTKTAFVPLVFDPDAEIVPPTVTVEPDEDLVDGQPVHVTGTGFVSSDNGIGFRLCGSDLDDAVCEWLDSTWVDEDGVLDVTVNVYAVVRPPGGDDLDCRTAEQLCQLVVGNGSPTSPRSTHVPLHFDPDGPLLPTPEIEVEPATDLADEATVTVTGRGFLPHGYVSLSLCRTGAENDYDRCDVDGSTYVETDAEGAFTAELPVTASFRAYNWTGEGPETEVVECRADPGCEILATSYAGRFQIARASLAFAPEPPEGDQRYIDRVFDEVDVTHDVVYRETVDGDGQPVQLTLDIYEPKGDTAQMRPAVMWMHGGWFDSGSKADMAGYAADFARRGYVAVTVDYRTTDWLDTSSPQAIKAAMLDGYDNAAAALALLHEHAGHYRIDHEAIAVGGAGAGATNAFDLAYLPGEHGRTGGNDIAAALAIGGVSLGTPDTGDVPVLAFNGSDSTIAPLHMAQWTCEDAAEVDATCEAVAYQGNQYDLELAKQRDITRRSLTFLADEVLRPLGYIDDDHHPTPTTSEPRDPTSTTSGSGGSGKPTTTAPGRGGNLPNTGSDATMPLVLIGLGLSAAGAGLVVLARRRRRAGGKLPGAVAGVLFVALAVPVLSRDASAQEPPHEHPTSTTSTTSTTSSPSTTSTTEHQHPTTTAPPTTTTTTGGGSGSTTSTTHHGGGGHELPPEWDPDQVAYATKLIDDTEASLARFDTQAVLPLMGYTWIFDGTEAGTYQHWISVNRIGLSDSTINPTEPESLVFRQTDDGPVLEAAMYILGASFVGVDSVPEPIKWLPGWHIHDNLCSEGFPPRLVGLTDEHGNCARGTKLTTPPMLHVWIVDTGCGRFPGVDEHGLICDPEHPHD